MPDYAVHIVTDATPTDDQLDALTDAFATHNGSLSMADGRLTVQLTVDAPDLPHAAFTGAAAAIEALPDAEILAVQAMTDPEFELWLNDGLVDTVEAGKILGGISRQRVLALEGRPGFPEPIRRGHRKLWRAAELRRYARVPRTPGRPAASA